MKEFLTGARKEYDLVILDTPPIGLVTDSAVLSSMADALIYVTAVGKTDKKSYYSYNYQYYDYYGEDEDKEFKRAKKRRRKRR